MIDGRPEDVWAAVRDVGAVHTKLVPGYTSSTRVEGEHRYLTMADGWVVHELIVSLDDDTRRLAYAVVEGSRPALTHHHASFQVFADGPDRTLLVWITDLLPDEREPEVRPRIERGAEVMRQALARIS